MRICRCDFFARNIQTAGRQQIIKRPIGSSSAHGCLKFQGSPMGDVLVATPRLGRFGYYDATFTVVATAKDTRLMSKTLVHPIIILIIFIPLNRHLCWCLGLHTVVPDMCCLCWWCSLLQTVTTHGCCCSLLLFILLRIFNAALHCCTPWLIMFVASSCCCCFEFVRGGSRDVKKERKKSLTMRVF